MSKVCPGESRRLRQLWQNVLLLAIEDALQPGVWEHSLSARKTLCDKHHVAWMLTMAGMDDAIEPFLAFVDKMQATDWAFSLPRSHVDYDDPDIPHKLRKLVSTAADHQRELERHDAWVQQTQAAKSAARAMKQARRLAKVEHKERLRQEQAADMAAHRAHNEAINAKYRAQQTMH